MDPRIHIESSFDGQTCLVKGSEVALADTLRGFLDNALLSSGVDGSFAAAIRSTGKNVVLKLSERNSGSEWSLQFPEFVVYQSKEGKGVSDVLADKYAQSDDACAFEYMSFEEEDRLASRRSEEIVQPDCEQTSS